jgi:hypothetical protein
MRSADDRKPQRSPRQGIKPVCHRHLVPLRRRLRSTAGRSTKTRKPKIPKPDRSQSASMDTTGGESDGGDGRIQRWSGILEGGIATAAIAGVSHYRKCLQQDSGQTIVFDSDGWTNFAVFTNLVRAAQWVKGKVALDPLGRRESRTSGVPKSWPQLRNTPTIGHDRRRAAAGTTNPLGGAVQGPPRRMHQKGAGCSRRPYRGKRSEQTQRGGYQQWPRERST